MGVEEVRGYVDGEEVGGREEEYKCVSGREGKEVMEEEK